MAFYPRHKLVPYATPALLTGTSSEFLGKRASPKLLRERHLVVVLGPAGSGKTSVATRLAGPQAVYLDGRQTHDRLVECIARSKWADDLVQAESLVLDGPCWLRRRPAAVAAYASLFRQRIDAGRLTLVVQNDDDASIHEVLAHIAPGEAAVVGLRFPKGPRGKLRFARKMCDELLLPRRAASGTEDLEPWEYERVLSEIKRSGTGE